MASLALLPACGFIGFEGHTPDASTTPPGMPGHDASTSMDAAVHDAAPEPGIDSAVIPDTGVPVADAAPDAFVDPDPPATRVNDYCVSIPRLQRDPVIDGKVDSHLNMVDLQPKGWAGYKSAPLPTHTTATFAFAWRPNGLYVFIHVVDPNRLPPPADAFIWQGDGVEVYFDTDGQHPNAPEYENPGTIQIIVEAPADNTTPATRSERFSKGATQGNWASSDYATFPTDDGYVFEGFVQADAVNASSLMLQRDNTVGVDLSINVSVLDDQVDAGVGDVLRLGQYFLSTSASTPSCGGLPFCDSAALCSPMLVD
ncbi:MAG: sugar-binding protein [Myxococcales bacterium]